MQHKIPALVINQEGKGLESIVHPRVAELRGTGIVKSKTKKRKCSNLKKTKKTKAEKIDIQRKKLTNLVQDYYRRKSLRQTNDYNFDKEGYEEQSQSDKQDHSDKQQLNNQQLQSNCQQPAKRFCGSNQPEPKIANIDEQ